MIIAPRTFAASLLALLLLAGCGPDRDAFARGDDDSSADDDDAGPDDDDAGPDDDDAGDDDDSGPPICTVTIEGMVAADPAGALTTLALFSYPERDVNEFGYPTSGSGIEALEVDDATFPFEYRLCGVDDGTVIIGFLFDPTTDMCMPGGRHGALFIDPTTETELVGQDFTLSDVVGEDDCPRDGEPPPE